MRGEEGHHTRKEGGGECKDSRVGCAAAREFRPALTFLKLDKGGVWERGVFWYADKVPRVHALNAAHYFGPDSSSLYLSAFKGTGFRFPTNRRHCMHRATMLLDCGPPSCR